MTKEFANNNRPETTPEELSAKFERPEIVSMLIRHWKEYVDTGILDAYRRSLLQGVAPITDDAKYYLLRIMSLEDIARIESRSKTYEPFILKALEMKAPLLVSIDTSADLSKDLGDKYANFSSTRYLLKQYDVVCGKPDTFSSVEVAAVHESGSHPFVYEPFTEEQFSIIESHYREQLDNGIVIYEENIQQIISDDNV